MWAAAEQRLYWFDIKGRRLNWFEPATDEPSARIRRNLRLV